MKKQELPKDIRFILWKEKISQRINNILAKLSKLLKFNK
jgi:hypothetical protein